MDHKLLLAKCITLLFKESLLKDPQNNSRALIEEAIRKIQPREVGLGLGLDKDVVTSLKGIVLDLLSTPHDQGVDRASLLQSIRIGVGDNDKLYQAIEKTLVDDGDDEANLKSVTRVRSWLDKQLKDMKVSEVLASASALWNFQRDKIRDTKEFLTEMWSQLEPFSSLKTREDPAMIDQVRLSDVNQLNKVVEGIRVSIVENQVYKTGFQGLNRMLQGGIRRGEFWVQAALQHKYKTGFSQSIFNQIALYNKPMITVPGKKPALVHISFEDTTSQRFEFIYKQMKYTETRQFVDVSNVSTEEMQSFILQKLSANGFELFFYRIDPTQWSYRDLFNLVIEIENSGHSIEFVMIDYLEKLPTIGCIQSGPSGNDLLDLFTRVRVFFNAKGIACWTPHQLNTESKKLIRGTITEDKFVQALVGRGYYKGSSQLDQIPDGILLTHLFQRGDKWYFAIQRDRHRISSIVDERLKLMYLEFPDKMPIPDDINDTDSTLYKLPQFRSNVDESMFSFD